MLFTAGGLISPSVLILNLDSFVCEFSSFNFTGILPYICLSHHHGKFVTLCAEIVDIVCHTVSGQMLWDNWNIVIVINWSLHKFDETLFLRIGACCWWTFHKVATSDWWRHYIGDSSVICVHYIVRKWRIWVPANSLGVHTETLGGLILRTLSELIVELTLCACCELYISLKHMCTSWSSLLWAIREIIAISSRCSESSELTVSWSLVSSPC